MVTAFLGTTAGLYPFSGQLLSSAARPTFDRQILLHAVGSLDFVVAIWKMGRQPNRSMLLAEIAREQNVLDLLHISE